MLNEREIGAILAAQLMSAARNKDYGYVSSVGAQYSHLNESGKRIMSQLTDLMFIKAVEYDTKRKQDEAEQLIMDNLKK